MDPEPSPKTWPTLPPPVPVAPPPIPAFSPPPPPIPQPSREDRVYPQRHRERHGHGTHFRRGRMWVIGIFCALRLVDVSLYLVANAAPAGIDKSGIHSSVITSGIWTTTFLVAIWFRHGWARYLLIALVLRNTLSVIVWLPETLKEVPDSIINPFLILTGLIHVSIAWALISVSAIRRLTNKSFS